MNPYPAVDPIPLPAPVWLLKLLHIVTLSLHFVAVEMLLGGLLLAVVLSLFRVVGQRQRNRAGTGAAADRRDDLRDQPGRAAAPVCAGALRARALHQQRADRRLLDRDHSHADADLLAALPVLGAARRGQIGVVGGADRVAAGGRRGADALNQYDADAAARGVARDVFGVGDGRVSAHAAIPR